MLFRQLDRIKRTAIMSTIILMFIGNIFLVLPEAYIPLVSSTLAFCLLVVLAVSIMDFISSSRTLLQYIYLALGLLAGLVGIMLFIFDELFVSALGWLVGTIPILFGAYGIFHAIAFARNSGRRGWWILIVLSCCLLGFGGVVFWNPWTYSTQATMQVIGGTLMFSAIVSVLRLIWLWPIRSADE